MRYAVKGKPDFHAMSDSDVKSYKDLAQALIFAYKQHDPEKAKVLESIWKDLSDESSERLTKTVFKSIDRQVVLEEKAQVLKKPALRKSPKKI